MCYFRPLTASYLSCVYANEAEWRHIPHVSNIRRICVTYVSSVTFVMCANFEHRMRQFGMSYASIICVICVTCVTQIRHIHVMCASRASRMCVICVTYVMCQLCHLSQLNVVYVTGDMCMHLFMGHHFPPFADNDPCDVSIVCVMFLF